MEFWLAPMEGVTDCAFRTLCCKYGADLTFAPMARVDSILRNRNEAKKIFFDHYGKLNKLGNFDNYKKMEIVKEVLAEIGKEIYK